ncbi:MAG TPA: right-handed parallel beta-helix repeat-containing protein [Verrucomicrobiae bacterium]|nr:right-handed parallel beta-helix repeat-containing protein [Verrucomicrobiae bacterium]
MSSSCKYVAVAMSALLLCSVAKADIRDTIQNAKSGTTVQCSGSYTVSKIVVPSGVTVKGPATFNFNSSSNDGFSISGSSVTLQSLTIKAAKHGVYCKGSSCKFTSLTTTGNHDTGIDLDGASSCTVSSCTSYDNADSSGGNADGFGVKDGCGSGISFSGCIAYSDSDDGFDFYGANGVVTVSSCQAYSNGSYNGKTGNGDGFKMGGSYNQAHKYTSCTAHNNTAGSTARGFDTNHNTAKIALSSCHSYSNKNKDVLGNCTLSNCTMQQ